MGISFHSEMTAKEFQEQWSRVVEAMSALEMPIPSFHALSPRDGRMLWRVSSGWAEINDKDWESLPQAAQAQWDLVRQEAAEKISVLEERIRYIRKIIE